MRPVLDDYPDNAVDRDPAGLTLMVSISVT